MEYVVLASAKLNGGSARRQICHNTHNLDTIPDYHKRFYGFTVLRMHYARRYSQWIVPP